MLLVERNPVGFTNQWDESEYLITPFVHPIPRRIANSSDRVSDILEQ